MLTFLLHEHVDLVPHDGMSCARLPDSQKHAIILPLLKKSGLDSADMANFVQYRTCPFCQK